MIKFIWKDSFQISIGESDHNVCSECTPAFRIVDTFVELKSLASIWPIETTERLDNLKLCHDWNCTSMLFSIESLIAYRDILGAIVNNYIDLSFNNLFVHLDRKWSS